MMPVSFIRGRKIDADPAVPHTPPEAVLGLTIGDTVVTEKTYNQVESAGTVDGSVVAAIDHTHGTPPPSVINWPSNEGMPPGVWPAGTTVVTTGFPQSTIVTYTVDLTASSPTIIVSAPVIGQPLPVTFRPTDVGAQIAPVVGFPVGATIVAIGVPTAPGQPVTTATVNPAPGITATGVALPAEVPGPHKYFGDNGGENSYTYDPTRGWVLTSPYDHELVI